METIRYNVFETNSSSTHALTIGRNEDNYTARGNKIKVVFSNTDNMYILNTLSEKVSYLVSHIVDSYVSGAEDYDDLIDQVKQDFEFKILKNYVKEHFNKEIVFPKTYRGDIEDIVYIDHQLIERTLDDVLYDILYDAEDKEQNLDIPIEQKLDRVLSPKRDIMFGRDG